MISVFYLHNVKYINYSRMKHTQFTVVTEKLYSLPFKFEKQKPCKNYNKIMVYFHKTGYKANSLPRCDGGAFLPPRALIFFFFSGFWSAFEGP